MASFEIPTRDDLANYNQSIALDGVIFNFEFRFNTRDDAWYFNLLDEAGNRIRSGIKTVANFPLLRIVRDLARPAGELVIHDPRVIPAPPALEELGDTSLLIYLDAAGMLEVTGG